MRNMLHNQRGSIAFATVVALVPLIGFLALGAEAGSWYVTKQHAQTAADAAAYSGGLQLACNLAGQTCDSTTPDTRAKQVAARNAFCNPGDTSYPGSRCVTNLPNGTSQSVTIDATLTSFNGISGKFVQATVTQTQPTYMAQVLGMSTINIASTAVAKVDDLAKPPCALALNGSIAFQGSPTLSSPTCGIASNSNAADAIGFKGNNGIQLSAPSYTVGGCSQTGGSQCTKVQTYQQPIPDPLSQLKTAISSLKLSDFSGGSCGSNLKAFELPTGGACYNGNITINSDTQLCGTYYFNGTLRINGSPTFTVGNCPTGVTTPGVTLVFFGSGALNIQGGNPTFKLTALQSPAVPSVLSSVKDLMAHLLIYDGETSSNVRISGSSTSYFNGTVYVPNSPVTYAGNADTSAPSGCYLLIASAITFSGNTKLDNSQCVGSNGTGTGPQPKIQTVRLLVSQ